MDSLIPVINKLQDVFSTLGEEIIELPQIVVIGAQSSGKSSVLESLVGRPFLPRGVGMVTRCPIILQLVYAPLDDREHRSVENGTLELPEWCKFLHKPGKIFTDFDEVREEIEAEAERNAGNDKGICTKPVNLQVYSTAVVSLTVVDLPGMVQMSVDKQPLDIKDQIYNLLMKFVENPNSIILAISPANVDIATSESLKLAKEVDPYGKRTLAVITKLDLMDKGTDAMDVLCGLVVPVKLGIIGVVNRSHQDNQNKKSIEDSIKAEVNFLEKKYASIASRNGTPHLARTLNQLLIVHINKCLPALTKKVDDSIRQFQTELDSYGIQINDDASKRQMLLRIITNFSTFYNNAIDGDAGSEIETKEARGGARISYLIHEKFDRDIQGIDPIVELTDLDILMAIRNASGVRRVLLVPESTFEKLVKKQIERLKEPALKCVRAVYSELQRIMKDYGKQIQHEMIRFPGIHKSIVDVAMKFLAEELPIAEKMVENLISFELAYINKQHPEFLRETSELLRPGVESTSMDMEVMEEDLIFDDEGYPQVTNLAALANIFSKLFRDPSIGIVSTVTQSFSKEDYRASVAANRDCRIIRELVKSYFCIVRKGIQDSVPKSIMFTLVNYVQEHLQSELTCQLFKPEGLDAMLKESPNIASRRQNASTKLQALKKANDLICEIGDSL